MDDEEFMNFDQTFSQSLVHHHHARQPQQQQRQGQQAIQGKDESALKGRESESGPLTQAKGGEQVGGGGLLSALFPSSQLLQQQFPSMLSMSLDVNATEDSYNISCDLPGVDKNSIDIEADKANYTITIKAEKKQEIVETEPATSGGEAGQQGKEKSSEIQQPAPSSTATGQELSKSSTGSSVGRPRVLRQERVYGKVERSLRLASDADLDKINAKYENGVLKIAIPRIQRKAEEKQKTKKITVQ